MKRFNFLLAAIAIVLTVTAVSCTTMTGTQDDYYDGQRVYGNRVYVDDPYRGTIVLERDPWTGRYYEVSPYNGYFGNRYYGGGSRVYRRNTPYYGNGGYYRKNSTNTYSNNQNNQKPLEDDRRTRDEARKKILGN